MRKLVIGALTGAMFFAVVAVALALSNNTVSYKVAVSQSKKASAKNPANVGVAAALDLGTTDNKQPNTAARTELYYAKGTILNSKAFASCKTSDIDNKSAIPAKCQKARIGSGSATAVAGKPGSPELPAATEKLSVDAYNGNKGKQVLLVLNGTTPLKITNRVIPGTIAKTKGKFAYKITFLVPPDLQKQQVGATTLQVAMVHLDVTIKASKTAKVKAGKKSRKVSYVQLSKCGSGKKLPTRAVAHFNDDTGNVGGPTVTNDGSAACK